ncbi:MalY/PatB family protein [Actinomyces vulturis]|uniref:MalY/PatB family protein n=1 Tax=Actinomyces vulturis TaxID=1857645 RepID=UPI00082CED9F|nr:aminotransferase class I/II-fold pyridoxal phosphate-dependent enzyme [Actinomyces vulturis]
MTILTDTFDALTPDVLRSRGSLKWTTYNDAAIGAWVAEMDLGLAPAVADEIRKAVSDGTLGYMPPTAPLQLTEALVDFMDSSYGWAPDIQDVALLPDVLAGLRVTIEHFSRPGSAVIVPTPAYMPFLTIPSQLGRACIEVPALRTCPRTEPGHPAWSLDLESIEQAMKAGAGTLILCNPWNPTGRVLTSSELDAVAALSSRYGVVVFADEIHAPLVLDPSIRHIPYASRPSADPALTISATSASKGWNIPGLKCAQAIVSGDAKEKWQSCGIHLAQDACPLGVRATTAAYTQGREWLHEVIDYIRDNARFVTRTLNKVPGLRMCEPEGTYLGWIDCTNLPISGSPADFFLTHAGVAMNDGITCGSDYSRYVRLNMATGRTIEKETVERLVTSVESLMR